LGRRRAPAGHGRHSHEPCRGHDHVRRATAAAAAGHPAYEGSWPQFFDASPRPIKFDIVDLKITAGQDVAFAVALMRCAMTEGGNVNLDFRLTIGLRKINVQWIVTHEHHSVPATS
jgi:ketosteroid isomerase-like protein